MREKNKKIILFAVGICLFFGLLFGSRKFIANRIFEGGNIFFGEKHYNLSIAEKFYRVALAINPDVDGAHYQTARIYFLNGRFKLALKEIDQEIETNPDFKRSFYVRGLINGYAGDFFSAIKDFEEFLKWKPESWAAHNDLAWIYFQIGNYEKVAELARDGLKYAPGNPWLLNTQGMALYNLGRKDEAKIYLEKALSITERMAADDWEKAYPGNDPAFSELGLKQMLAAIKNNSNITKK